MKSDDSSASPANHGVHHQTASSWRPDQNVCKLWKELDTRPTTTYPTGMEALDPESEQIRDVYAQYGVAMYYAQCVERQLAIVAPMLHGMNIRTTTRDQLEKLLDELFKKTLGTVIKKLETSVGLPAGFEDRLRDALRLRNFLAHDFFWERAGTFTHEQGRQQMLTELREAAVFLADLDEEMSILARDWSRNQGVTDEVIRAEMNKLTAHGGVT